MKLSYFSTFCLLMFFTGVIYYHTPDIVFDNRATESNAIQGDEHYCATDLIRNEASNKFKESIESFEKAYQNHLNGAAESQKMLPAPYVLPIVFHIIHNNGPENITDAQVLQSLADMNLAFANQGYYDPSTGAEMQIEFCLAKQDPNGAATTGINRVVSPLTNMTMETEDLAVKNLIRWEPTEYINVWIVDEICSNSVGCGVAGYAYFPSAHGGNEDGIMIEDNYTGTGQANSGVLIHEMGHYLGLYHTFQGGCTNNNCLSDGDRVCDTPPDQSTAQVPCGSNFNSCSTDVNAADPNNPFLTDQDDMYINYMDYGDLNCYTAFTLGQRARMHFAIENTRNSLLNSPACNDPCFNPVFANFAPSATLVNTGSVVTFLNSSFNATSYQWLIDGVPFSNAQSPTYSFLTEGTYTITLVATNADPNCMDQFSVDIQVTCPVTASFVASGTVVSPGDAVLFTNTSVNATTYAWYVDGAQVSTTTNYTTSWNTVGNYDVQLVASDGICMDTSALSVITVTENGLAGTGLPIWPVTANGTGIIETVDWTEEVPVVEVITNSGDDPPSQTGVAIDGCGNLAFYAAQTGSSDPDHLNLYAPDGVEILSNNTANGPGLNGVRGGNEIQVVRVPGISNQWYIIYSEWSSDVGSPINNAAYNPARMLYSRVRLNSTYDLTVMERDVVLEAAGVGYDYTDGRAVSRTNFGNLDEHLLYACRRNQGQSSISLDRFVITNVGIFFQDNTGTVNVPWWSLTMAGSPIELSPTEEKIAVTCRNQSTNRPDVILFDAINFNSANAISISGGDLILIADGQPNDLSNELPYDGAIESVAFDNSLNLRFLRNFERKLSRIEFSPNGRFLYLCSGGYAQGGVANLSYLAQIDLEANPLEVRLQIQTTPNDTYNAISGVGCQISGQACNDAYAAIGSIQSSYDGNLYFSKRHDNLYYVIPNPNDIMPQNLVPSDINLSTAAEPNIIMNGKTSSMPDQIDGFNYFASPFIEVELIVNAFDCNDNCLAPYDVVISSNGFPIETIAVESCPDTLLFCADTTQIYDLTASSVSITYDSAIVFGQVNYNGMPYFDFSDLSGCIETCGNMIDDDNDGLVDCDDPDIQDSCCCQVIPLLDLGPDVEICDNGVYPFNAGSGFVSYQWSDLTTDSTFTAFGAGTYWVNVTDICGDVQSDTVVISIMEPTIVDAGSDTTICLGESVAISTLGWDEYQWTPIENLDCSDCPSVVATPDTTTSYILVANTLDGCFSVDTVTVFVADTFYSEIDTLICNGGAFELDGTILQPGESQLFTYITENGCDSTIQVNVIANSFNSVEIFVDTFACANESVFYDGVEVFPMTSDTFYYQTWQGCDSTIYVDVTSLPIFDTKDTITICANETATIFGNIENTSGDYQMTFDAQNTCDSTHTTTLIVLNPILPNFGSTPTCANETNGTITDSSTGGLPPFTYEWSHSTTITTGDLTDLSAGDYHVTITDANDCIASMTVTVSSLANVQLSAEYQNISCYGAGDGWIDMSNNMAGLTYSLDGVNFTNNAVFNNLEVGNYTIYAQDDFSCIYTTEVTILEPIELFLLLPEDTTICMGDSILLESLTNVSTTLTYTWSDSLGLSCGNCAVPWAMPLETSYYSLTITDSLGCTAFDEIFITVDERRKVYIPNSFSPNGDGMNDVFQVYTGLGVESITRMDVYDRWGELVYQSGPFQPNNPNKGWNGIFRGKPMNSGIFVYLIEVGLVNGETETYTGDLLLVR